MLTRVLSCAALALLMWSSPADAATSDAHADSASDSPRVVLVGVAGLTWSDVGPDSTPALWSMLEDGAPAATMSMFATINSCSPDGWLTVSTGVPTFTRDGDECVTTSPTRSTSGVLMSNWDEVGRLQSESPYNPELGLLVEELQRQQICVAASGPGAAATAADSAGAVRHYGGEPVVDPDCSVSVVDAGGATSEAELAAADAVVAEATTSLPPDATVVVFSVPSGTVPERTMGVAIQYQPDAAGTVPRYLTSPSTRWPGVVSLIDLPPTVIDLLGETPSTLWAGNPWSETTGPADVSSVPDELDLIGTRDNSLRQVTWFFLGSSVLLGLALLSALATGTRGGPLMARIRRMSASVRLASWLAAFPVASFTVGALPWWQTTAPVTALYLSTVVLTAILGELVHLLARRRGVFWACVAVSSTLAALIVLDLATGQVITRGSPLAPSPLSGGRFYGLSNATSAALAIAAVWSTTLLAGWVVDRHRHRPAIALFGGLSLAVILMTALPGVGADLGGALTLLPTFAVTGIYLFRVRMTVWRTSLVLGACLLVPVAVAVADYARPADDRTHLGRFVELVVSGQAWELVSRKAGYAVGSLSSVLSFITLAVLVVIAWQLVLLIRHRPLSPLWSGMQRSRVLSAAVLGSWTAMVTGSILNDYGIRMATIGLIILVPLLLLTLPRSGAFRPRDGSHRDRDRSIPTERAGHVVEVD